MPQNNCETHTPRCIEIRPHLRPPEADKTGRRPDTTHNESSIDCLQRLTRHDRNHTTTSSWCRGHDWGLKRHGVIVTMKGYREEGRVDAAQHAKKDTQRQSDGADEDACVSRFNSERSCLCIVLGNITRVTMTVRWLWRCSQLGSVDATQVGSTLLQSRIL